MCLKVQKQNNTFDWWQCNLKGCIHAAVTKVHAATITKAERGPCRRILDVIVFPCCQLQAIKCCLIFNYNTRLAKFYVTSKYAMLIF